MKPENFAYWLQGSFEVPEKPVFTSKEFTCINNHLRLVFVHFEGFKEPQSLPVLSFCHWLRGYHMCFSLIEDDSKYENYVFDVSKELATLFKNVIEKERIKETDIPEELHEAHGENYDSVENDWVSDLFQRYNRSYR